MESLESYAAPVFAVALLTWLCAAPLAAQDGSLPHDLGQISQKTGCIAVPGFYNRPGSIDPPYAYGIDAGIRDSSAAFWCYRESTRTYLLVVTRGDHVRATLSWTGFPGGLTVTRARSWALNKFRRVDDHSVAGPADVLEEQRALQSTYDGVTATFIEYRGVWYFRLSD